MRIILTDDELRACCCEWQRRLRLQDWDITIKRVRSSAYRDGTAKAGDVEVSQEKRMAVIRVTEPDDYDNQQNPDFGIDQDMERTLVHELVHLHFAPLWHVIKGDIEDRFEEHAVNAISAALVAMKREESVPA